MKELTPKGLCSVNPSISQDYLDNYAVISSGEDWSIVVDIRHIDVYRSCVDSGWTAVIRRLNSERVT